MSSFNGVLETAYRPGDNMEQFELEMYERHNNFFKDAKASGIDTWCERSKDSASKEVKRVRAAFLFFTPWTIPIGDWKFLIIGTFLVQRPWAGRSCDVCSAHGKASMKYWNPRIKMLVASYYFFLNVSHHISPCALDWNDLWWSMIVLWFMILLNCIFLHSQRTSICLLRNMLTT